MNNLGEDTLLHGLPHGSGARGCVGAQDAPDRHVVLFNLAAARPSPRKGEHRRLAEGSTDDEDEEQRAAEDEEEDDDIHGNRGRSPRGPPLSLLPFTVLCKLLDALAAVPLDGQTPRPVSNGC